MFTKYHISEHTTLYRCGKPFPTGAVVADIPEDSSGTEDTLPGWITKTAKTTNDNEIMTKKFSISRPLAQSEAVFGLGQQLGPLNKRGKKYRTWNTDDPIHTPEKDTLYGSHPFLVFADPETRKSSAIFIDFPGEIFFDIGFYNHNQIKITIASSDADIYLLEAPDPTQLLSAFFALVGSSFAPPRWAFGYQQSRWSYPDADHVRRIAETFREKQIPCDAIYLDLDYMEDFQVFTTSEERFPDFSNFVNELRQDGFRLVPIIDPGVKVREGYPVYEEGCRNGYFCTDEDGQPFKAAVWPGWTHLPDFLNPETARWWGEQYRFLTDQGIEAFWNDMNEPALMYTEKSRERFYRTLDTYRSEDNPGVMRWFETKTAFRRIANDREDFRDFYHHTPEGRINHEAVHNLYGFAMCRATIEGLDKQRPGQRNFLLSRSSYTGMHRYCGIWTGDNASVWPHLLTNLRMALALNLCGFLYCGADTGGFGHDTTPELLIRWTQLSLGMPLLRNHSALGTRDQEPWAFDTETEGILKNIIRLRYALLPYIYSEYMQAILHKRPLLRALFLDFPGRRTLEIEDQYMLGQSLMLAPVISSAARGRYVHLPEGQWLLWRAAAFEQRNQKEMQILKGGDHYLEADLAETLLLLRENHLLILEEPRQHSRAPGNGQLIICGLVTDHAILEWYIDDGDSKSFQEDDYCTLNIEVFARSGKFSHKVSSSGDREYLKNFNTLCFELYDQQGQCTTLSLDTDALLS